MKMSNVKCKKKSATSATCIHGIDYKLPEIALYWHHQLHGVGIIIIQSHIRKVSTKVGLY